MESTVPSPLATPHTSTSSVSSRDDSKSNPPECRQENEHSGPKSGNARKPNMHWGHSPSVPRSNDHRCLILCFDGTGDQFDNDNSNVVNFFSMLKKDDPQKQLVYYQAGIGTYSVPQIAKPFMAKLHRTLDSMVGKNLHAHVMSGYDFLMQNYQDGDKIFMFGFSRGAYTARALAGMIHKVGLLPRSNYQQVPFAYSMYASEDEQSWEQSTEFKKSFSIDVDIEMVGVWDTVSSVGLVPSRLPFTTSNAHVKYFRHAIALDEHRVRFVPNFWSQAMPETSKNKVHFFDNMGRRPNHTKAKAEQQKRRFKPKKSEEEKRQRREEKEQKKKEKSKKSLKELEEIYDVGGDFDTQVEEVWFSGCHADVGGGAVPNKTRHALARIPLRWMVRECFKLKTGILFLEEELMKCGLDAKTLHPEVLPRPPPITLPQLASIVEREKPNNRYNFISEEVEDLKDSLSPSYDELRLSRIWWLLELHPIKIHAQGKDGADKKKPVVHWGRARQIPKQHRESGLQVHETVKQRMEYLCADPSSCSDTGSSESATSEEINRAKRRLKWTHEETGGRPNGEKWKREYRPKLAWDAEPVWTR